MLDFSELLDKPLDNFEAPKPLPTGYWHMVIREQKLGKTKSDKQTPFVEFTCGIIAPLEDVNEEDLAAFGDLSDKTMRLTFYLTPESTYRVKEFAKNSIEMDIEGMSLGQVIQSLVGAEFSALVQHRSPQNDPTKVYAEIASTMKLPS